MDAFDVYLEAVESLEWSFVLTCSLFGVDEAEMESTLGCRCPYGLYGYLEELPEEEFAMYAA